MKTAAIMLSSIIYGAFMSHLGCYHDNPIFWVGLMILADIWISIWDKIS